MNDKKKRGMDSADPQNRSEMYGRLLARPVKQASSPVDFMYDQFSPKEYAACGGQTLSRFLAVVDKPPPELRKGYFFLLFLQC